MKRFITISSKTLAILVILSMLCSAISFSAVSTPKLSKTKKTITVGKTFTLTLKNTSKKVKWSSSNKKIAKISSVKSKTHKAVIKAIKKGKATITAKIGKNKYKCIVTVKKAAAKVSQEYLNALASAKTYSDYMHMSKKGIFDQLVSPYGENFPVKAAQYAIDNLKANYKINALKTAQSYSDSQHMSKQSIYDQLISEYGEKFTKSEAQYAVDNLKANYKKNALETAKTYYYSMNMSKQAVYDQLISEYGEKFTKSEAQYAIDHLD